MQGSTLRLYPRTREAITSHPTNATLTNKFRALFSHHATRVLCLTRRGWEGTQRIQPHPGQLTLTKYVCPFLRQTPTRTRHILYKCSTKYSYLNRRYMERLQRNKYPATEDTYILSHYRPASPCEYNLPTPCPPPVPILVRLKIRAKTP